MAQGPITNAVMDISHYQGNVDMAAAKGDGIVAVIHKATQGTNWFDNMYAVNRPKAAAAGVLWGAYHFGTASGDGATQAQYFLQIAKPDAQTLVVLDFEENKGSTMTLDQAHQFVTFIHTTLNRWPVLYGGSYLKSVLAGNSDPLLANCPLWWAQYAAAPVIPPNWKDWTLWQYTDGTHGPAPHQVQGVGPCDRDQFNGDMNALKVLWGVGGS
ncbi:MAG: glycoside hydrolase family 25 protein [Acidobacteriia bacterium]|nr:glycoside hydrolase family 25 protein [Terriglobia bacterium]